MTRGQQKAGLQPKPHRTTTPLRSSVLYSVPLHSLLHLILLQLSAFWCVLIKNYESLPIGYPGGAIGSRHVSACSEQER
jgi:hypothetical protein